MTRSDLFTKGSPWSDLETFSKPKYRAQYCLQRVPGDTPAPATITEHNSTPWPIVLSGTECHDPDCEDTLRTSRPTDGNAGTHETIVNKGDGEETTKCLRNGRKDETTRETENDNTKTVPSPGPRGEHACKSGFSTVQY
jgi:hypothetical protein